VFRKGNDLADDILEIHIFFFIRNINIKMFIIYLFHLTIVQIILYLVRVFILSRDIRNFQISRVLQFDYLSLSCYAIN